MTKLMRTVAAVLLLAFLLCAVSCSDNSVTSEKSLSVVTTVFPPYDFARQISEGVSGIDITMLLPPGSESHDYEPSVGDIAKIGEADLIITVGGETDEWIDGIIKSSESKARVLRLTDMVELLEEDETVLVTNSSHHHGDDHSHEHGESCVFDEHVWTSPENAAIMTEKIAEEMCRLSEENSDIFKKNSAAYSASLRDVQKSMKSIVN